MYLFVAYHTKTDYRSFYRTNFAIKTNTICTRFSFVRNIYLAYDVTTAYRVRFNKGKSNFGRNFFIPTKLFTRYFLLFFSLVIAYCRYYLLYDALKISVVYDNFFAVRLIINYRIRTTFRGCFSKKKKSGSVAEILLNANYVLRVYRRNNRRA